MCYQSGCSQPHSHFQHNWSVHVGYLLCTPETCNLIEIEFWWCRIPCSQKKRKFRSFRSATSNAPPRSLELLVNFVLSLASSKVVATSAARACLRCACIISNLNIAGLSGKRRWDFYMQNITRLEKATKFWYFRLWKAFVNKCNDVNRRQDEIHVYIYSFWHFVVVELSEFR